MESDAAVAEFGAEVDQVHQGPAEPVEPGGLEGVALAEQLHHEVELRPGYLGAAGDVDMDVAVLDAGAAERVDLMVGVLVRRGDAGVTEDRETGR